MRRLLAALASAGVLLVATAAIASAHPLGNYTVNRAVVVTVTPDQVVVRYLIDNYHLPETRLSAAGYADTRPLYPPSDPRAVTQNRRVEVVVMSSLPADERALLPGIAKAK